MRASLVLSAILVLWPTREVGAATVLAVLDLKDETGRFDPALVRQWSWYLKAQLTETGQYLLLPPAEALLELDRLLADSHRAIKDDTQRPEPGRRASAERLVEPRLIEAEGHCAIIALIYDVERGAADRVTQRKATCDSGSLARAAREIGRAIAGEEDLDGEVEPVFAAEVEVPLGTDWLTVGLGYGSTLGGASGMMITAQLFTLRGPWWSWRIVDAGVSLGASRDSAGLDFGADHSMIYAGTTMGLGFNFGGTHRLDLSAGPALYHADADDFFGEVRDADATGGLVPAALLALGYSTSLLNPGGLGDLGIGVALRAVLPAKVDRGAPQLVLATLTLAVGG